MATDVQNWTKAYNKKNPNATDAARKAALAKWQKARRGGGNSTPATGTNPGNSLPVGWGVTRTPDILGSWGAKPNLDPTEYEIEQGQDKKYYARKRTELTGLEGYQKDAIRKWDSDTANRGTLLTGAEQQAVNAATTIGNANAARMTDLASLIQAAPQSQALGGVQSGGGVTQQSANNEQRSSALAAGAGAQLAATRMATAASEQAKNAPTLATYSMASLANKARSDDAATRQKLLSAFRATNAEAKAAKDEAIAQTYTDQARLLAAAIQSGARITAEQLSQMGQNFRTTQTNETSLANNAADNATSTANAGATADNAAANARAKVTKDFVSKIPGMVKGDISVNLDPQGNPTGTTVRAPGRGWEYVMGQALAQNVPLGPVLGAIAATPELGRAMKTRRNATRVALWMRSKGIPNATIRQVISKHLGVDIGTNGGLAGPGRP